jgi:hypothetical protein
MSGKSFQHMGILVMELGWSDVESHPPHVQFGQLRIAKCSQTKLCQRCFAFSFLNGQARSCQLPPPGFPGFLLRHTAIPQCYESYSRGRRDTDPASGSTN